MNKRIILILPFAAGDLVVARRYLRPDSKPSILFILTDNLGYGEVGAYGGGVSP